ncbi:MAG: hypothetical protein ACYS1C_08850 [Planctomycetota bacterium]|jgi:hypothetical protein
MRSLEERGIDPAALDRFIEEQIYALPGVDGPSEVFTILLTGSRGAGIHTDESDVDIDLVCPQAIYASRSPALTASRSTSAHAMTCTSGSGPMPR